MKLTLEHLAPYLPYNLKIQTEHIEGSRVYNLLGINGRNKTVQLDSDYGWSFIKGIKPILRPLTDLDKGMFDEEAEDLIGRIIKGHTIHYGSLSYATIQYLSKNHYDFQNLIMKGLAVNINQIKQEK